MQQLTWTAFRSTACCAVRVSLTAAISDPTDESCKYRGTHYTIHHLLTSLRAVDYRGDMGNVSISHGSLSSLADFLSLEQNTGQIAANLPLMPALYRALQEKLPSFSKIRFYLLSSLRGSYHGSFTQNAGFSQVHEDGDTPLGTFPVRKTIDVDVT